MKTLQIPELDSLFSRYIESGRVPGIQAVVADRDTLLFDRTWGYTDLKQKKPLRSDAFYRIYSMTKPVTVVALFQLVEKKLLRLDDPVSRYLPLFGEMSVLKGQNDFGKILTGKTDIPITVEHLLTMRSGMSYGSRPDEDPLDALYRKNTVNLEHPVHMVPAEKMIELLAGLPLAFPPGSSYRYAFSIDIAGAVLEKITGRTLDEYFRENIFDPLRMSDTGFSLNEEQVFRLPALYILKRNKLRKWLPEQDPGAVEKPLFYMGGSGLYSTAGDYIRFCRMLLRGGELDGRRIISPESIDAMTRNRLDSALLDIFRQDWPGYGYGCGFRIMMNPEEYGLPGTVGEYGWDGAASTWMMVDPVRGITALLMMQVWPGRCYPIIKEFREALYRSLG